MGTLFTLGLSHTYRAEVNISRAIFKANLVKFDLKSRRRLGQSQGKAVYMRLRAKQTTSCTCKSSKNRANNLK